jgi:hypothetical protein
MTSEELRELARKPVGTCALFTGGAAQMADLLDATATMLQLMARTLRLAHYRAQARDRMHPQ